MRQVHVDTLEEGSDINEMSFYSASEGYVAFKYFIGFTSDSGRTFTKKYIAANVNYNGYAVNLTIGFSIGGIKAFNQSNIIVYGHYGLVPSILYSTDGGDTYTLVFHSQFNQLALSTGILSMAFPGNSMIGYASDADRILKTTDGGLHWSVIRTLAGSYLDRIQPLNNDTLFLAGNGNVDAPSRRLIKSVNAGTSWTSISLPGATGNTITDYFFLNSTTGWISLYDSNLKGYFYRTTNGGLSWTQLNDVDVNSFASNKMKFLDANTGYMITGELKYRVYKTVNGGVLWEPLPRDNSFEYLYKTHFDMYFHSANQFWAGGGVGFLELTTNGGGTPLPKAYFKADTTGVYNTDNVQLRNYSNTNHQYQWYVNGTPVSNGYHATYIHDIQKYSDTIMLVVSNGNESDTTVKVQQFFVPIFPVVTSFVPQTGSTGTFVSIKGKFLTRVPVTDVRFGGTAAASFTILSDTTATAIVANGATGAVSFSDGRHLFSSAASFTYFPPPASAPPVISSLQPSSGPAGTAVTITGTNFGNDNIVYFGAVRATVVSSAPNQVNCIVPAGASYKPVSVLNTSTHLTGSSVKPFALTFADSSNFTSGSFTNAYNIFYSNPTSFSPLYIKARDINNDGKPDIVVRETAGNTITAYKNTGSQGNIAFGNKLVLGTIQPNDLGRFDMNDLDGDGLPDIVTATNRTYFYILKNNSTADSISFATPLKMDMSDGSQEPVIADLDDDGRNDIAMASFNYKKLSVIRNTGNPGNLSFAQTIEYNCEGNAKMIAAGDIDGDGKKDLVTLNYRYTDSTSISCFHNNSTPGNISFGNAVNFIFPGSLLNSAYLAILDYDNDGKPDIVAMNRKGYLHVFRNTGTSGNFSFDTTGNHLLQISLSAAACIDNISGDGKPDGMFASESSVPSDHFTVSKNNSVPGAISNDAEVTIYPPYAYLYNPYGIEAGDFNLDGKPDIVTCSSQDKGISIYKNNVGQALPQTICAAAGVELLCDLTGSFYQWQQDTGTGYHNISNDLHFSGVTDSALQLTAIPSAWYNYSYRCVVGNRLFSQSYKLIFTNKWIGSNSNWNNPANWSCNKVPDENIDVLVSYGTVNVTTNSVCRSLTITNTGHVAVSQGVNLQVMH